MKKVVVVLLVIVSFALFYKTLATDLFESKGFIEINISELEELLKKEDTVLVYFHSPYCSSCHSLRPKLTQVAQKYNITIYTINIDKEFDSLMASDVINTFEVESTPTLISIFQSKLISKVVGNVSEQELEEFFSKTINP